MAGAKYKIKVLKEKGTKHYNAFCFLFTQIKLIEVVETSTKVFLVLELASKGDLLEYINTRVMLSEDEVRMLFFQLAAAMTYCHKEHVVHRDLKCENILIGGDGKLKVTGNKLGNFQLNKIYKLN